jgi:protein-tyrosine-phosphatase
MISSMNRHITVVCRHNQARSVSAAAGLARFFPEISSGSVGVLAVDREPVPPLVLGLLDEWGLQAQDVVSHSLVGAKEKVLNSDFVIVAEDHFIEEVLNLGVNRSKILSMQDYRFAEELIPSDPIGKSDWVISFELAKSIMTSVQMIRLHGELDYPNKVEVISPWREEDFAGALRAAWQSVQESNGVMLVSDFRSPNFGAVSALSQNILEIQVARFSNEIRLLERETSITLEAAMSNMSAFAISSRFEIDNVERFVLSTGFIDLIARLAASRTVVIVTEPWGISAIPQLIAASGSSANLWRAVQ